MFWKNMSGIGNDTLTENSDRAFVSSLNTILDLFSRGGSMRTREETDIINLIVKSFVSDPLLTMKCLFYLRDVRGGCGERRVFRIALKWLANNYPEIFIKNFDNVFEMGRWDDLFSGFNTIVEPFMTKFVSQQLISDIKNEHPSLLAKWMPSENASSKLTKERAIKFIIALNWSPSRYRKTLSELRKKIDIVERKMSSNAWGNINYEHVPSRASLLYRKAFFKHDQERYKSFISSVLKGEKKINAGVLYPHEIIKRVMSGGMNMYSHDEILALEALWKSLPDYAGNQNAIVMADTSGSMHGDPITIAIGLALYFAERNKNLAFKDYFMTFSKEPEIQHISGNTIVEKVMSLSKAHWDQNTDLRLAFKKILERAINNKVSIDEMPETLYIISDMQFDEGISNNTTYDDIKEMYEMAGYKLPMVVFWNVNAYNNSPVTIHDQNTILVSGSSPVVFKYVLETKSKNPLDFMLGVLLSDRYSKIVI